MRRADSDSLSDLEEQRESTSSMKMIDGLLVLAISKSWRTSLLKIKLIINNFLFYFSDSPSHFETRSLLDTEMNVELAASVATALAMWDFPVPGGPNSKIPRHGVRFPE